MNLKLLIAACCLLAAVQARPPKPPATSCSVACVSRTFWTGYQVGKVYTYQFEQKVELSSELSSTQSSRLQLAGLAKVEVHSDCEMALTVEVKEAKVGEVDSADALSPREPPAKVIEALRLPLRFAFENGQVSQICPSSEETRASLNLKRGILSQLQVSTEQRGQAHQLEERDILGDCWTEYTPEGPNTLLKTKDLAKCKLNYQAYPLMGVKSFDDQSLQSHHQPITQGSLKCRIEIDAERDIVKETTCSEEQIQSADHGPESAKEKVRTSTRLTLQAETSGLVSALQEVSKRTDLRHAHKTIGQCHSSSAWLEEDFFHSGNECIERSHGAESSAEYRSQAKKLLEELCEVTKSQGMSREAPKKYADLIKYLRGITEQEHFNQLYKWVRDGYCSENPLLKTILRSAIPAVGTKQSVSLILNQLSNSEVEGANRNSWLINGIALMQHPTPEILPELLNYVKKRRDDAMLGVTRDEPLALSAVVHKICQELPNCEAEPRVKAVIDYFSDSLGPACEQFSRDSDNAFVALLSVGNMGRVAGGAGALVRCAANQRLPTVHRVFALHSLRRFAEFSPEAQDQLAQMMLNSDLDSELRIAAYQALSRHGFDQTSRLHEAVRRLLNDMDEDRQVQMFVYTHAQGLQGEAARQIAPVLRSAKTVNELEKLSRRQYSSSLRTEYFSKALGAGAQVEAPIVFSAQSAIPRYIGLNLTVNALTQGQSINLMEIGLRMQGLENLVEELYRRISQKYSPEPKPQGGQQASPAPESELTAEQRSGFGQTPTEPRIDLLVRRYGAELSHTDLSGGMIESIPEIVSKADYSALVKILLPSSPSSEPMGLSAGTLAENTLSIPTIAGLPILVKREMHYLTNLRIDKRVGASKGAVEATFDLKPSGAVLMSHTVAVDAIFERAGIQSSTSFLTSTGLRLSLVKNFADDTDRQFSFKVEPLMKRQNVADAKTEVNFFQHTAGKVHVEKPLVPQQGIVKREKCTEGLTKKYTGHKMCYKTEYLPGCKKSLRSFCKCPGTYQLFLEKNDDFGAYEVTFNLKNQDKIKQLQVIVGDQKSKDRLLKFNAQFVSEGDRTNYKLELQNPIFPIVLDSNVTKASEGYRLYSEVQAGSVEYVASGSVQPQTEKGLKMDVEFSPKEKPAQKMKVSLEHQLSGFSPLLLPIATSKLRVRMHTGNQLNLEYNLQHEISKFLWQISSQYRTNKAEITSMRYRVQYNSKPEESTESSSAFLYDFEVQNPKGNNLVHSLHTKLIRRSDSGIKHTTASVNHKIQYGIENKRSPIDFDVRVTLRETADSELFRATGDGALTHFWQGEAVTVKLENLKIQKGEAVDEADGFGKQYMYSLSYGIKLEETSANYEVELRHLHWKRWTWTQQAIEMKVKAQLGAKSYNAHLKHSLNGEKYQTRQIAKLDYNGYAYFHLDHKMTKAESSDSVKNELLLQGTDGTKVQAKWGIQWPEQGKLDFNMVVEVNDKKMFGCTQTLRYTGTPRDHQLKHEMTLEMLPSSYTLETNAKISRQSAMDLTTFLNYQVRLITGRYKARKSLRLLAALLKDLSLEHSSKLTGPTPTQRTVLENVIDMTNWSNGLIWKNLLQVSMESKDIVKYGVAISTIQQFSDSPSWNMKKGIKLELNAMDQSIITEVESNIAKDSGKSSFSLKMTSRDTWGWHDVKVDALNQMTGSSEWETNVKLEGEINKRPITSTVNIKRGSHGSQDNLIASVATPASKLEVRLSKVPSPLQLSASARLDGDFGVIPFKDMKAKVDFTMQKGVSFESKAEIDGTQVVSAKVQVATNIFIADLKTAHPRLQEAGIKIVMDKDIPEAVKCSTIVRFVSLTRNIQFKKTGTATLSYKSPMYSFLLGLAGKMEFEGFDDIFKYKNLDYELMLKKKPGMEFQFVTSVSSPDHTSAKLPMLFASSTLNYWPFKAELKFKANNYQGWDVKYGVRAEVDYKSAFIGMESNGREAAMTYDIQDQPDNLKTVNFRVKCDFCAKNLVVGQANMTWPLRLSEFEFGLDAQTSVLLLQKITLRFVHRPVKKQMLAAFTWDGETYKLIDCSYVQSETEGGVQGSALLHADFRFFLGQKARASVKANYQYGRDNELSFAMALASSDEEVLQGKVFWLTTRTYEIMQNRNVDQGFQLKGFGMDTYVIRTTKSEKNFDWRLSVDLPALHKPITARLEIDDGKIKSGEISAFDRELILSSQPDSGIQVTLRTKTDETKTLRVKWSGKYESQQNCRGKLEIEADGKISIFEAKVQPRQIVFNYGMSTAPNSLKIAYEVSDMSSPWYTTVDLTISHETDAEKNSELTLLPGYQVPLPTTRYPFKLVVSAKNTFRLLAVTFESLGLGVKSTYYKHDFTRFPHSFTAESNLINTEGSKKVWDMKILFDKDAPNAEALCQIDNIFKMSFKEPKFQLQIARWIDLTIRFPTFLAGFDDSDKKELNFQLTLPALKINELLSLQATYQRLAEGRQLKLKYGRGDDDQIIMWSMTGRKFRMTPKFEIDWETSLASKHALLGNWQIRSVEARQEINMEPTEAGSYTIKYGDSIKVNGDDLATTILRLGGEKGALPRWVELTVTGKMECTLKIDLGSDDKPIKIRGSLDKFGDSREKYALKLDISPMETGVWCPDFKVETECPHRHFVIGKESKKTGGETRMEVQFYLNKREEHGATIVYKVESPTARSPKYTVEIALPTRKIRTVWQPEISDKKFGIMTRFDWDADKSQEKAISLDASVDYSSDVLAIVECQAPFLTNRVKIESRYGYKEGGYTFQLKKMMGESEVLQINGDYSYQRLAQTDVARFSLETTGAIESKFSLSAQAREEVENFRRSKVDGTLEIKIYSMEKRIKFVYRPMREITVTCDHGASLSVKYITDKMNLYQWVVFASGNDKSAARLKLVASKPMRKFTVKLDTGSGSFNHNSDLRGPNYRPETVLLQAELRREGDEVSATAFAGKMAVGQKPNPFEAAVPSHISFFAWSVRKAEYNKMKFRINWRTPSSDKMNAALDSLKLGLSNYKVYQAQVFDGVSAHLATIQRSAASTVNAAWITEELAALASNDFDKLNRYFESVLADNEFYLRQILGVAVDAGRVVKRWLDAAIEAAAGLKETLNNLQIVEKITEGFQQVLKYAADFVKLITIEDMKQAASEYIEVAASAASYWYQKAADKMSTYYDWLWTAVSNWSVPSRVREQLQQANEYMKSMFPISSAAKEYIGQVWSQVRSITGASLVGMKSFAIDDLLPLAVNHLDDLKSVKELYDNMMLEMRIWYDSDATPKERAALSQTANMLSYIFSEEAMNYWQNVAEGWKLIANGDVASGLKKLYGKYSYTVWRPVCDSACQSGETFAAIEGYFYAPDYVPSWPMIGAPGIVLRRIGAKLLRKGLPEAPLMSAAIGSLFGAWNPIDRLLAVRHRTAILSGDNHLVTFDGLALSHERPCSYLVAHDFHRQLFSVVQEYRKVGDRQVRDRLRVRFGSARVIVDRDGAVQVNGKPEQLPMKKEMEGKMIEASRTGDHLTIRFHANLRDTLVLRCSPVADSCVISVHPLYQGSVHGLAGSNDGRRSNDIYKSNAREHVKFWTVGQCATEGSASADAAPESGSSSDSSDCFAWFRRSNSPLARCFDKVDPRPYHAICQRQEKAGRDPCKAARQYAERCIGESVRVMTPAKCVACRLDSNGEVTQPGLVTDKAALQKRIQVVFLVENSACGLGAIGAGASRIRTLAGIIDGLKASNPNVQSIQFGLAHYGGGESPATLVSVPMGDTDAVEGSGRRFGSLTELGAALARMNLDGGDDTEASLDVLRAVAELPAHYQWQPLAQKHLIVISCKPCTAGSWGYARLFAKAQRSVKDQIHVHAISKAAVRPGRDAPEFVGYSEDAIHTSDWRSAKAEEFGAGGARQLRQECSAELATDADSAAKGSVWRMDNFSAGGDKSDQLMRLLVGKAVQSRLDNPDCRKCSCRGQQQQQQPWCRVVKCDSN